VGGSAGYGGSNAPSPNTGSNGNMFSGGSGYGGISIIIYSSTVINT